MPDRPQPAIVHSASILKSLGLFTRVVTIFAARFTGGFNRFVTSTVAPVASGWSYLAGWEFHPLGKRRLTTAHAKSGHIDCSQEWVKSAVLILTGS